MMKKINKQGWKNSHKASLLFSDILGTEPEHFKLCLDGK